MAWVTTHAVHGRTARGSGPRPYARRPAAMWPPEHETSPGQMPALSLASALSPRGPTGVPPVGVCFGLEERATPVLEHRDVHVVEVVGRKPGVWSASRSRA